VGWLEANTGKHPAGPKRRSVKPASLRHDLYVWNEDGTVDWQYVAKVYPRLGAEPEVTAWLRDGEERHRRLLAGW